MFKLSVSDCVGVGGLVLTLLLIVLDKAGKLRGAWLLVLLAVAGIMTLFLAIGNSWVADAPIRWRWWVKSLMFALVCLSYSALAIWITSTDIHTTTEEIPARITQYDFPRTLHFPDRERQWFLYVPGISITAKEDMNLDVDMGIGRGGVVAFDPEKTAFQFLEDNKDRLNLPSDRPLLPIPIDVRKGESRSGYLLFFLEPKKYGQPSGRSRDLQFTDRLSGRQLTVSLTPESSGEILTLRDHALPTIQGGIQGPSNPNTISIGPNSRITIHTEEPELPQRRLTRDQRAILLEELRRFPSGDVLLLRWNSRESQTYVGEFDEILKEASWKTDSLIFSDRPPEFTGIVVGWKGQQQPPALDVLSSALKKAGIHFAVQEVETTATANLLLDVGVVRASAKQIVFDRIQ